MLTEDAYRAANGHMYSRSQPYSQWCLDNCPCHGDPDFGAAEDYAGERWDDE